MGTGHPGAVPSARHEGVTHPDAVVVRTPSPRRHVPSPAVGGRVEVHVRHLFDGRRRRSRGDPHPAVARGVNPLPGGIGVDPLRRRRRDFVGRWRLRRRRSIAIRRLDCGAEDGSEGSGCVCAVVGDADGAAGCAVVGSSAGGAEEGGGGGATVSAAVGGGCCADDAPHPISANSVIELNRVNAFFMALTRQPVASKSHSHSGLWAAFEVIARPGSPHTSRGAEADFSACGGWGSAGRVDRPRMHGSIGGAGGSSHNDRADGGTPPGGWGGDGGIGATLDGQAERPLRTVTPSPRARGLRPCGGSARRSSTTRCAILPNAAGELRCRRRDSRGQRHPARVLASGHRVRPRGQALHGYSRKRRSRSSARARRATR